MIYIETKVHWSELIFLIQCRKIKFVWNQAVWAFFLHRLGKPKMIKTWILDRVDQMFWIFAQILPNYTITDNNSNLSSVLKKFCFVINVPEYISTRCRIFFFPPSRKRRSYIDIYLWFKFCRDMIRNLTLPHSSTTRCQD